MTFLHSFATLLGSRLQGRLWTSLIAATFQGGLSQRVHFTMQAGHEDNLKGRYAIKFCVKLDKSAELTYEMVKTAYGPSFMSQATVYRWHRRLQEGRDQVRDDERSGRERDVRTPELIREIEELLNEDRRVSLWTIYTKFKVGEATAHSILHEDLNLRKVCAKFVPKVLSADQKERCVEDRCVEWSNSSLQTQVPSILW